MKQKPNTGRKEKTVSEHQKKEEKKEREKQLTLKTLPQFLKSTSRLLKAAWHNQKPMVIGLIVVSFLMSSIPFLYSGALGVLVNKLVEYAGTGVVSKDILFWLILLVSALVIPGVLYGIKEFQDRHFWISMSQYFEMEFLKKKGELDIARYEDPKFNDLLNNAHERSIYPMSNLLEMQIANLQNIIGVIIASVVLIGTYPTLFVLIFAGALPKFIVGMRYGKENWGIFDANAEDRRRFFDLRRHFYQMPTLVELKLFQATKRFHEKINTLVSLFNNKQKAIERKKMLAEAIARLLSGLATGAAIAWLVFEVINENLQIGTLTFLVASMNGLGNMMAGFFMSIARQYEHSLFVNDIYAVLDTQPLIIPPTNPESINVDRAPRIEFENVSFAYPGTNKMVLKNISLTIEPGEKIALVGANGSGKTSLVKLLCRFYDPTRGRILINGIDLREVNQQQWYGILGVLFQDFGQYNLVAKEAIAVGRLNGRLKLAEVLQAARASQADTFIQEWENKYDQQIGKEFSGGVELSKGQQQKLALARTFYRDPRVLVLDEPTASIDSEAEGKIFARIEAQSVNRTLILISHRFSTVRNTDRICVLENGSFSEIGSHRELVALGGTYARLFESQARAYQD